MATQFPNCIRATRIGHWSMGSESGYDAFGEQAPVTWMCNCGHQLTLENFDYDTERYIAVSQDRKTQFLADHTDCKAQCYKCGTAPVDRDGDWCEKCSEEY